MRLALVCFFGLLCLDRLPAQTSLSGPVEAFTFDAPTRSLRAVIGVPGASSFGPALVDNLDFASVAPHQNYGIALENGNWVVISGLGSKSSSTLVNEGVSRYPDGVAWSGDGTLAVLYSRAGAWFQPVSGLPSAPSAGVLVDVSALGGTFSAMAVDSQGKQIAVGMSGDSGAVYQAALGQPLAPAATLAAPVALSFSRDGQTLYALDGSSVEVSAVSLGGHGVETLALPGMKNPVAIQSAVDSQNRPLVYVAGASDKILRIIDVTSQQIVEDIPLNLEPASVAPFGSSSFVLASRAQAANPLWLFSSAPQPRAYFVPAIQSTRLVHVKITAAGRGR